MEGELRPEIEDWFYEACVDLEEAEDALSRGRNNWACFAAQQAAGKALKAAYLAIKRRRFPRTHDLLELYLELRGEISVGDEGKIGLLSSFYELSRYPNAGVRRPSRSISSDVAREMLNLAKEVVRTVGERIGLACGPQTR
ncbi:MAG: HEPN domain-containing protein [Nitrososphaerota archaeon]|nr:HEPN domain-containing protein [Candidatus Calditenuis fumarioli]